MLRHFLGRVHQSRFAHPRLVLCAPSGITDVERRALVEASAAAGAGAVALIEEPLAAAIGSGLEIAEPSATMIVDVGGGTSEVALISMGGIVCIGVAAHRRLRLRRGDQRLPAQQARLATGTETAERLKIELGSAWPVEDEKTRRGARAQPRVSGLPAAVALSAEEIRGASRARSSRSSPRSAATLEAAPPELAGDIATRGIHLAGGGVAAARLPASSCGHDRHRARPGRRAADVRRPGRRRVARGLRRRAQGDPQLDQRPAPGRLLLIAPLASRR